MKLLPHTNGLRLLLEYEEATMLDQLVTQLADLLSSHSSTALDPDPLFASLEVGGSERLPEDPALARLFPNAYDEDDDSNEFRQVTEQGLLNRKLQDAMLVTSELGLGDGDDLAAPPIGVEITPATLPAWVRTVTALRLAIAARIGLDSADDHARLLEADDTRGTVLVFDWLAAILESVLAIMTAHGEATVEESDAGPGGAADHGPESDTDEGSNQTRPPV